METIIGKICILHPEAGGLRSRYNGHCVKCIEIRDARKAEGEADKARRKAEWAAEAAARKAWHEADKVKRKQQQAVLITRGLPLPPITYFGRICIAHPEFNGERRSQTNVCVECHREKQRLNPRVLERRRKYMQKRRESPEYRAEQAQKRRQRAEMKRSVERFDDMVEKGQVDFTKFHAQQQGE